MPRWESCMLTSGQIEHTLDGRQEAATVTVDPARKVTVITVGLAVAGSDDATVERCQRRAEELMVVLKKGGRG